MSSCNAKIIVPQGLGWLRGEDVGHAGHGQGVAITGLEATRMRKKTSAISKNSLIALAALPMAIGIV